MKYIKEYSHEFYQAIDDKEFYDKAHIDARVPLSQTDRNIIINYVDQIQPFKKHSGTSGISFVFPGHDKTSRIDIYGAPDEWFICSIDDYEYANSLTSRTSFYKCDQLEGLFKLIRDNI